MADACNVIFVAAVVAMETSYTPINWMYKEHSLLLPNSMSIGWMVPKVEGRSPIDSPLLCLRVTFLGLCLLGLILSYTNGGKKCPCLLSNSEKSDNI